MIMTIDEANKFLENTKVYVGHKYEEVQNKLFSLGYRWIMTGGTVIHKECAFIRISKHKCLSPIMRLDSFLEDKNRKISADDILNIEIENVELKNKTEPEQQVKSPWISVKDELPKPFDIVFITIGKHLYSTGFVDDYDTWHNPIVNANLTTKWMHIPE